MLLLLFACPADDDDDDADDTTGEWCACSAEEACIATFEDTGGSTTRCEPLPAACATPTCDDNDCWRALYDLCADGYIGVGCSDPVTGDDPIIYSCNVDG
jgi:hypothetical protein